MNNNHRKESGRTMLSDTKTLSTMQTGDAALFETLFLQYYQPVYGLLFRLLGNRADAEDVAQQVFLKLYHAPRLMRAWDDDDTNLAGWLYRVAVNTGYNALRSRNRRRSRLGRLTALWPTEHTAPPNPETFTERQEQQAAVRRILAAMKPRDAKLLLLRHSGLSYKEIAAALRIAPGSVGSLLTRAERAFAQRYRATLTQEETYATD